MIVGIHQPNYLPWLGYFHKMQSCDVFVLLDDVLCSNKAERRNAVKGSNGIVSLSLPIKNKKSLIKDIELNNELNWKHRHMSSLQGCYVKSDYWEEISPWLYDIYQHTGSKLIDLNLETIELIRHYLGINTPMIRSSELSGINGDKNQKIINICKSLGADVYLSGMGAKTYMDQTVYQNNDIKVVYQMFEHPIYPQRWGKFIPNLSAIDLLLNSGPDARHYLTKQVVE